MAQAVRGMLREAPAQGPDGEVTGTPDTRGNTRQGTPLRYMDHAGHGEWGLKEDQGQLWVICACGAALYVQHQAPTTAQERRQAAETLDSAQNWAMTAGGLL